MEWINVKNRLPEAYKTVLAIGLNGVWGETGKPAYLHYVTFIYPEGRWHRGDDIITHWMPLPDPPTQIG